MNAPLRRHLALVTLTLLAACGERQAEPAAGEATATPAPAAADAAPSPEAATAGVGMLAGHAQAGGAALPEGHPPLPADGAAGGQMAPSIAAGVPTSGRLTWTLPKGWTEEKPSSSVRTAQASAPGPGGPAELAVFYFGPGQGGDAMANAERWADQFTLPGGGSARSAMKTEQVVENGIEILLVEVAGTYAGGMGSPTGEKTGYRLLGAVAKGPDANWFFKLTGPDATIQAQRQAFRALLASLAVAK